MWQIGQLLNLFSAGLLGPLIQESLHYLRYSLSSSSLFSLSFLRSLQVTVSRTPSSLWKSLHFLAGSFLSSHIWFFSFKFCSKQFGSSSCLTNRDCFLSHCGSQAALPFFFSCFLPF
uniref:Uncharacterized protein n=1 Tax=Rhizophora mucronata TaxID=61149 RepID=A0A2P2KHD3_RHIMU